MISGGIVTSIATTTAATSSRRLLDNSDPIPMAPHGTNQALKVVGIPTRFKAVGPDAVAHAVTSLIPPEPTVPLPGPSTSAFSQQLLRVLYILQAPSTFLQVH